MEQEHAGHRQRMKDRFLQNGLKGFAPHEMLELLLFFAIPRRNVNPLAHRLLAHFGTLHGVMDASFEDLCDVKGLGRCAALLIMLVGQFVRAVEWSRQGENLKLTNRQEAQQYAECLLKGLQEENLYAVCLNGQMEVISNVLIARGTINEVYAYPREVIKSVLRYNSHLVLLCHNHPGGSLLPSPQDLEMTNTLSGMLMGVNVILADHIIVCDKGSFSMFSHGLMAHARSADGTKSYVAEYAKLLARLKRLQKQSQQEAPTT